MLNLQQNTNTKVGKRITRTTNKNVLKQHI